MRSDTIYTPAYTPMHTTPRSGTLAATRGQRGATTERSQLFAISSLLLAVCSVVVVVATLVG